MPPRAPAFWTRRGPVSTLLAPLGALYGLVAARRMRRPAQARVPVPVVVVGNFVLGGAGKTPTALHVVERARALGALPFVVTRGYGGSRAGPHRVDPGRDGAAEVGDEALAMAARGVAVVVARDRAAGARHAADAGATLIVLDDGFQSPALAKDLAIVVIDAGYGLGNARVFPAGPLRAPLAVQAVAADLVVAIGEDAEGRRPPGFSGPVLAGRLEPRDPARFAGRRLLGYAGIGRPEKFRDTLLALGVDLAGFRGFADHRVLGEAEARRLLRQADRLGAGLVTTEKDRARLGRPAAGALAELAERSEVVAVDLALADEAVLDRALARLIGRE